MYEVAINGVKVGDSVLDPGFSTNLTSRLLYATYDVTHVSEWQQFRPAPPTRHALFQLSGSTAFSIILTGGGGGGDWVADNMCGATALPLSATPRMCIDVPYPRPYRRM